ncbi:MAG: two-component regulator propeller domain-containing protein [bacterium]
MKAILLIFLIAIFPLNLFSQQIDSNWAVITSNEVNDMVDDGENIWIAGYGLKIINKETDEVTYINKFNSDFPTDYAYSIAIDSNGNKWIGVRNGVIKYDNYIWTFYRSINGFPILSTEEYSWWVTTISVDDSNNIWLGTSGEGLVKYNGDSWKLYKDEFTNSGNHYINQIVFFDSNVYVATRFGICFLRNGVWSFYNSKNSDLEEDWCTSIIFDDSTNIWIGTSLGIYKLNVNKWKHFNYLNSELDLSFISSLAIDSNNNLIIAGNHNTVFKYNGKNFEKIEVFDQKGYNLGTPIHLLSYNGDVVFGGSQFGLFKIVNKEINRISDKFSYLPGKKVNCIKIVEDKIIIGTQGGAINCQKNGVVDYYLLQYDVLSVENMNQILFFGTNYYGLYIFDGYKSFSHGDWDQSLYGNTVKSIKKDFSGNVWMSAFKISKYNDGQIRIINQDEIGFHTENINQIIVDRNDTKWFGDIEEGLISYNNEKWERNKSPIPNNTFGEILSLAVDSSNMIWIGTRNNGILSFKNEDFNHYTVLDYQLKTNCISSIEIDKNNVVWIGTCEQGLLKFDGKEWINFNSRNSHLVLNSINCIGIDNNNNKWIATDEGLSIFNESGVILDVKEHEDISNNSSADNFLCYPNPASEYIEIKLLESSKLSESYQIQIYNVYGECLTNLYPTPYTHLIPLERGMERGVRIDVSGFPDGVYFVRIGNEMKKFVVLR